MAITHRRASSAVCAHVPAAASRCGEGRARDGARLHAVEAPSLSPRRGARGEGGRFPKGQGDAMTLSPRRFAAVALAALCTLAVAQERASAAEPQLTPL